MENVMVVPHNLKIKLPYDPKCPLLDILKKGKTKQTSKQTKTNCCTLQAH